MKILISFAIVAVAVVAALLITQPWQGDEGKEASADTQTFALCNTIVEFPRDGQISVMLWGGQILAGQLRQFPDIVDLPEEARAQLETRLRATPEWVLAVTDGGAFDSPAVYLDPVTGARLVGFGNASDRAQVEAIAATARRLDPGERGWPYSDKGAVIRDRVSNAPGALISWRQPDPTSGLDVQRTFLDGGPAGGAQSITLHNCRSSRTLVANPEATIIDPAYDHVDPADEAAFDAFFAEVDTPAPLEAAP